MNQRRQTYTVEPFFFGSGPRRLFGCAFVPEHAMAGVVLCPPAGHEYVFTHRILRGLAVRLAEAGLLVLRFDYSGTGDSAGDFEDARLARWMEDIALAQETLRVKFRMRHVCLVGLRLGATLALLTDLSRQHAQIRVLWDPVSDGGRYLEELQTRQHDLLRNTGNAVRQSRNEADQLELLGFGYSPDLVEDIETVDVWRELGSPGSKVLVVDGSTDRGQQPLAAHLAAHGAQVAHQHLPDAEPWSRATHRVIVPNRAIEGIVEWLKESTR